MMNFKKLIFILIFVMLLVGIGSVSAENIDDSDLSAIDNVTDEVNSADYSIDDNLNADEQDSLSGSRSPGDVNSWTDLESKVNSGPDTLTITSSLTPGNQININRNVTIVGSDNTYIGGSGPNNMASTNHYLFFSDTNGLSITLKNIKFQNYGTKSLIKFAGNGTYVLDNCTFENIRLSGSKQVVVHLELGYLNVTNCTFEKCYTDYGVLSNYKNDSAPYAVHMVVRQTIFRNNNATTEPGAINNCGQLIVYDSIFEDNNSTMWAGAIHTHSNANATIIRSTFRNNLALWNGGALSTYSYLTVINSTFESNKANGDKGGGAILGFAQGSFPYIVIENCDFFNNTASTNGGAITNINGVLIVEDSRFNDNSANGNYGGAISNVGMGLNTFTADVNNCRFKNNSAPNMGGAIFAINMGHLSVYSSIFINDTAASGNEIAYRYTGKKTDKAFFTYEDNTFYGADNASGAIYLYNNNIVVVDINNIFLNTDQYVEPENETTPSVVPIPGNVPIGHQVWNASIEDVLGGSPLIIDGKIFVPKGQYIYCLNLTNGDVLWNVSSYAGYFHELALHGNVLLAPCAGDKLYMIDPVTGDEIQSSSNIIQASSAFAPAIDGNTIYVSSECGYGANNNTWIAVVEYNNGVYSYVGSILEIDGITYGDYALLSAPILWNNYLWVNTVNGLMRIDLATNTSTIVLANTVGKPVLGGDYLYVLTRNNHICGVNASGDLVKTFAVSGNVGSTLAISNDNTTLYTVNSNGEIYRVDVSSNKINLIKFVPVNPVSSALVVGSNGYVYIGDDAGILWVIRTYSQGRDWFGEIMWAYNASSSILGMPVIHNNIVYIGTEDTFYALLKVSNLLNLNNFILSDYKSVKMDYELLCAFNSNEILSSPILISPGRLKNDDFTSSDSVYLLNGTYTLETGFWIGSDNNYNPVNNILIKPIESGSAVIMIDDQVNQIAFQISDGKNITFENIKFTTADPNKSYTNFATVFSTAYGVEDVTFRNCTFENIINGHYGSSTSMGLSMIFEVSSASDPAPKNLNIESCKFINISANDAIIWVNCGISDLYISDCIFENNSVPYVLNLKEVNNVYLSDNSFNSTVPITISTGKIADVSFKVLTESLTKDESEFIVGELIDDNGNRIYSANLKIKINNVEQTTNFDPDTGCYKVSYTPSEIGTVNVSAVCNNANLNAGHTQIPVKKPISTLTLGDNITFDYGKSGSTTVSYEGATKVKAVVVENESAIVKVENNNITVSGLNAGNYTLKVTAIADEDHENVSKTVKITVNKVNATINLNNITLDYGSSNSTTFTGEGIKNITASIEGQADKVTVSENTITVSGLNAGSYTLKVIVNPDENHNMIETTVNITVNKIDTVVNIANEVVYDIGSTGQCIVSTEGAVNITAGIVNHTEANITINNSIISINGLKAGKYVMNVTTNPDNNHKSVTVSVNVTVNLVSVPAAQALTTNVPANTKSPTFSIKLDKEATGTFTVNIDNGKIVKTAELKDGAASITVADLAAGDHTISVSYSGDGKYAPITQNTTLNIKEPVKPTTKVTKKATKIVAKKKTFKAKKKTKKYTITLKSGKKLISKVKVTIKVGKKTYTAKTNKKGKATFNLKKLTKKGKYTAVIKFKGNKNYKATSKKVKITVKK